MNDSGAFGALFGAILGAGLLFGLAYNVLIGYMRRTGLDEGLAWLQVVIGVLVTLLLAWPLVGLEAVLVLLALFAATGAPMAAGNIVRAWQARQAFLDRIREESRGDAA